jgi:cytochrome c-type biogenesis protein CcmH
MGKRIAAANCEITGDTMSRKLAILFALLCLLIPIHARSNAALDFSRPEYKDRYYRVIGELRCLVCQNQPIGESNAELAVDLRKLVYEMVEQGKNDEDIYSFMTDRYGDFVLYNPPFKPSTMLLWFAPFVVIGIGCVALVVFIKRRNKETVPVPEVSESVRRRVEELTRPRKEKVKGKRK